MAHNWKNPPIKGKTLALSKNEFKKIKQGKPDKHGNLSTIDDKLIISILKQKPDSIDDLLIGTYSHCAKIADSVKTKFPSGVRRFFYTLKNGIHPVVEAYRDCNTNGYKLMWTLGQPKSKYFDSEKLKYHNAQLSRWQRDPNVMRLKDLNQEYDSQTVVLQNRYNWVGEINFKDEPALKNLITGFDTKDKCWKFMLVNKTRGFLNLGCQFAPSGGHGAMYKLELLDNNRLRIIKLSEWIS